jgi:hypothetical protein
MKPGLATCSVFTSPRLRGEVDARSRSGRALGEGGHPLLRRLQMPLTPTLSPQAGRGSAPNAGLQ